MRLAGEFRKKGYRVEVEKDGADLVVEKDGKRIAVEVETGESTLQTFFLDVSADSGILLCGSKTRRRLWLTG